MPLHCQAFETRPPPCWARQRNQTDIKRRISVTQRGRHDSILLAGQVTPKNPVQWWRSCHGEGLTGFWVNVQCVNPTPGVSETTDTCSIKGASPHVRKHPTGLTVRGAQSHFNMITAWLVYRCICAAVWRRSFFILTNKREEKHLSGCCSSDWWPQNKGRTEWGGTLNVIRLLVPEIWISRCLLSFVITPYYHLLHASIRVGVCMGIFCSATVSMETVRCWG